MNNENKANQADNMGNQDSQNTGKEKYFTQDDVNKILQSRMARLKDQAGREAGSEYQSKLEALEAREKRLSIMEALNAKGYDMDLADIIKCDDVKDLEDKLKKLEDIYSRKASAPEPKENKIGFHRVGAGQPGRKPAGDAVRKAMGMDY